MKARRAALAIAICAALVVMSGCTASPEPAEPTPRFATEEEAFEAAEATYRAYVDALNEVDLSDPATFEPVFALTTGDFAASERRSFSQMHADGWTVGGTSSIDRIDRLSADSLYGDVELGTCLNVTGVELLDSSGASIVASDRPNAQSTRVSFAHSNTSPNALLIDAIEGATLEPACAGS